MLNLKEIEPRAYQKEIFETTKNKNTLICLPTGTGKTLNLLLLGVYRLNKITDSQIAIVSPTKPLSAQHIKTFKNYTNISPEEIVLLTGVIKPEKRKEMYNKKVIIGTPQTLKEDLINNRFSFKNFSLLGVDEAHRAIGQYAYTYLVHAYLQQSEFPRILALTASPGGTKEKIDRICENLNIEAVEIRTEEDIREYIPEKKIQWIEVELPEEFKDVRDLIKKVSINKIEDLRKFGVTKPASLINKKDLLNLQNQFRDDIKRKKFTAFYGVSLIAQIIKLEHAIELLETQSLNALQRFLKDLEKDETKAAKTIMSEDNIIQAINLVNSLVEKEIKHPKMHKLIEIISDNFKLNKNSKVIVFAKFRGTVKDIVDELNKIENIKAVELLGQKEGVTQKIQIETIKEFEEGVYNTIVTSSIGEEGLDIGKGIDLAVFYDNVGSAIRRIQRGGRVARLQPGKIIFLITKKTKDVGLYWKSKREEGKMKFILKRMQDKDREEVQKRLS